jgi:peptide/nickel transport system substrate-binding protein
VGSFAALALVLAACGDDDSDSSGSDDTVDSSGSSNTVDGATLTWGVASDPGNLDPHASAVNVNIQMAPFAYDSLVHRTPDGEIVSGLAEAWEVDGNGYTFTLREDVTCSDDTPLTATDVAANFEYAGNPENGSAFVGAAIPAAPEVSADDEARTVRVVPAEPFPFFLEGVAIFPIVCKSGMGDRATLERGTAGTGPFVLTSSTPGQEYTYTVREGYTWGPDGATTDEPGVPEKVVFKVVANETTAANLLLQGELNVAEVVGPDRQRLEDEDLFNSSYPLGLAQMYFNETEGRPGADEAVRRALTMAVDLGEVADVISGGYGTVPKSIATGSPRLCDGDTVPGNTPEHDLEKAKSLLDEAGWTEGSGGVRSKDGKPLKVSLVFVTNAGSGFGTDPAAELTAEQMKAVGADVTLNGGTTEVLGPIVFGSGDWDIAWIPVSRSVPSQLIPIFSGATPPDGLNFSHISNPDYEAAVKAASQTPDKGGCPKWQEAEELLLERVDVVPLVETNAPVWGAGAEFEADGQGVVVPTSVRAVES